MKTFSNIMLILIFAFLVSICIIEEFVVSNSLSQAMNDSLYIEKLLDEDNQLKSMTISLAVDDLEYHWIKNESKMCYLVNHKNIQEIGLEISKLKIYQKDDDLKEFEACLNAVKFYSQGYTHFMGASVHNVL